MASTVVFVHGGFHGGWCWKKVSPILGARGWRVFTPTLTGLGERAHLASPSVTLETHIEDVLGVIEAEELSDVVLCGHSYAGMVITGVADRRPELISHLIYLDALVPEDGQSSLEVTANKDIDVLLHAGAAESGKGWLAPPNHDAAGFGVYEPDDAAWVSRRMTWQPLRTLTDKLSLTGGIEEVPQRIFVRCARFSRGSMDDHASSLLGRSGWQVERWDSEHDVMITEPERVADLIDATENLKPGRSG
jgi:pimeloyl-ACP methyl ester carboxylesterase